MNVEDSLKEKEEKIKNAQAEREHGNASEASWITSDPIFFHQLSWLVFYQPTGRPKTKQAFRVPHVRALICGVGCRKLVGRG